MKTYSVVIAPLVHGSSLGTQENPAGDVVLLSSDVSSTVNGMTTLVFSV